MSNKQVKLEEALSYQIESEEKDPNRKYFHKASIGYSQMICVEYPELADICMAFFYYNICQYAAKQDDRKTQKLLAQYREDAIADGLDEEDTGWQYVLDHRVKCMETTKDICRLVNQTISTLRRKTSQGDLDAKRALRALTLYDIETGEKPFRRNEPSQLIGALQYINFLKGPQFNILFSKIKRPDYVKGAAEITFDCFHHTELLLEYYKKFLYTKAGDELEAYNQHDVDEEDILDIMVRTTDKIGKARLHTVASNCAIKLVESTLTSLKHYSAEDGKRLYKSIERHYINQAPITSMGLEEWNNSWSTDYDTRDKAMRIYSMILWGYYTINVVDILEKTNVKRSKKSKRC